jgi:nitrous oxidase accessory protein NosD
MKVILRGGRASTAAWTALAVVAAMALSSHWLRNVRIASPERSAGRVFRVTSGADSGSGSLREGIFAADRANRRTRVVIETPTIVLETPLPPLLNPAGIVVEAPRGTVIDASRVVGGAVLDIAAPDCVLIGLRIERAAGQAILVRKTGARLRDLTIADSNVGVFQLESALDLTIENTTFERNVVGVHVTAPVGRAIIHNNRFREHRSAAIWAVAGKAPLPQQSLGVEIARNQFTGDSQPIVVVNVEAEVARNDFYSAGSAAVYISGTRARIRHNRMRSGRTYGVYADRIDGGFIIDNEMDHNCAGGMIVRNSRGTEIGFNRVYANGYGIILVDDQSARSNTVFENLIAQHAEDGLYVIGGSPIVRRNHLFENRKAGLRLSAVAAGDRRALVPAPLLRENVMNGNGFNAVRRDEYAATTEAVVPSGLADCAWRNATSAFRVAASGGGD